MEKLFHLSLNLSLIHVFGWVGLSLFLYVSLWSLAAIAKKRADLADVAWGPGFMLVAWASFFLGQTSSIGFIVNILITLWAIRLALHIYIRNRKREEDFRYQALKQKWGKRFYFKLFTEVFLLQGCILYIIALPIIWIHTHPESLVTQILPIALPLWLIGFVVETVADLELAFFKKNPENKGKLLKVGLWAYVRHPNYLGELLQWWAIWLIASPLPFGWALAISPLLLTLLIVKISGIQPLEAKLRENEEFKEYLAKTPSLIPPSMLNGAIYGLAWIILVSFGAESSTLTSFMIASGCYAAQLLLFAKFDRISLRICVPLSIVALGLGLVQEMVFIHFKILLYPNGGNFPPFWILALYSLFSLTLNSSLAFLNKNLGVTFFLGGFGALLSYLSGETLGQVQLFPPLAYPFIFLLWGAFLTILISLNRMMRTRIFPG